MTKLRASRAKSSSSATSSGRLFLLELSGDRIHAANPDGSDAKIIVTDCHLPDAIVVDAGAGHIYWTNMGILNCCDGSIERADLDGRNRRLIVREGVTHTPKQLHLDKKGGKLYWCDREGMRVMRANLDGSQVETLVDTGRADKNWFDQTRWCVGITIDPNRRKLYWTQKGPDKRRLGRIFRANIEIPKKESPANRSDIEVLFDGLQAPLDLDFDPINRVLYWADHGDPPRGNTISRASIDTKAAPEILITHPTESIGFALDVSGSRIFATYFAGSVYSADLDGNNECECLYGQAKFTGIAYAQIQQPIG
ncbi:DNA-binding beta-propeller fold protein YncE [Bradyrhizobium elkanii]